MAITVAMQLGTRECVNLREREIAINRGALDVQ
jgi:hypothetical protein